MLIEVRFLGLVMTTEEMDTAEIWCEHQRMAWCGVMGLVGRAQSRKVGRAAIHRFWSLR